MWRFPRSWGYPMFIIQLVVGDYQWENPCFGVAIWVRKPPFVLLWEAPLGRSISSKVTKLFWTALGGQGSRSAQCFSGIQTYFETQPLAGSVIKKTRFYWHTTRSPRSFLHVMQGLHNKSPRSAQAVQIPDFLSCRGACNLYWNFGCIFWWFPW